MDEAGFLTAGIDKYDENSPSVEASWQLTFRSANTGSDDASSGQAKAHWYCKILEHFLKPNGESRTNATLPSGRFVMAFNEFKTQSIGQDAKQRYLVAATFKTLLRAD